MFFLKLRDRFFPVSRIRYAYPFPPEVPLKAEKDRKTHVGTEKNALDFLVPEGTPVLAAADGVVILVVDHNTEGGPCEKFSDKANHIVISHGIESSMYFHLRSQALVREGQIVRKGQAIALQGSTGYTTEPHIHFSVYRRGSSVKIIFQKRKK